MTHVSRIAVSAISLLLLLTGRVAAQSCPTGGASVVYVNGINTNVAEAYKDAASLSQVVRAAVNATPDSVPWECIDVRVAYNDSQTFLKDLIEAAKQKIPDLDLSLFYEWLNGSAQAPDGFDTDYISKLKALTEEQFKQSPAVQNVVSETLSALEGCRRTVIVGHSQGNFVNNSAFTSLIFRPEISQTSYSVIGVATPSDFVAGVDGIEVDGRYTTLKGDIINLVFPSLEPNATSVSCPASPLFFRSATRCHNFQGSYMSGAMSRDGTASARDRIAGQIVGQLNRGAVCSLLSVTTSGGGSGTVSSTADRGLFDVDCGAVCDVAFPIDTLVTLTATPAPDSVFVEWTRDCAGTDNPTTVSLTVDKKCEATWNRPPVISRLTATPDVVRLSGHATVKASASDPDNDALTYAWTTTCGSLSSATGPDDNTWTPPAVVPSAGKCTVEVTVTDPPGDTATASVDIQVGYQIEQITFDAVDHKWPSFNATGDMVWSRSVNGFWQVFKRGPAAGSSPVQITSGDRNHERPVISNDGTIVWFQDATGGGLGYAIVRRDPAGGESQLEFSSRSGTSERAAGRRFGISSDGCSISYFTFFVSGLVSSRRFNTSCLGELTDGAGGRGTFPTFDYPEINNQRVILFTDDFTGGNRIYRATAASPFSVTQIGIGQFPRLGDGPNNEIVFVRSGSEIVSIVQTGQIGSQAIYSAPVKVANGIWADVDGAGKILFEKVVEGVSQIFIAR